MVTYVEPLLLDLQDPCNRDTPVISAGPAVKQAHKCQEEVDQNCAGMGVETSLLDVKDRQRQEKIRL